jgi:hypothetical protein
MLYNQMASMIEQKQTADELKVPESMRFWRLFSHAVIFTLYGSTRNPIDPLTLELDTLCATKTAGKTAGGTTMEIREKTKKLHENAEWAVETAKHDPSRWCIAYAWSAIEEWADAVVLGQNIHVYGI